MAKYINADKAAKIAVNYATNYEPCLSEYEEGCADTWENAANFIEHFESEDVAPVIHAHWIRCSQFSQECSSCRTEMIICDFKYCPDCGAKMDEEEQ